MLDEMNLYAMTDAPERGEVAVHMHQPVSIPAHPAHNALQVPAAIWRVMFACYGIFLGGLLHATGRDGEALFMIAISTGYTILYFGLSGVLIGLDGHGARPGQTAARGDLDTWTGPMSPGAVAGQILTIPVCLALFGVIIAVIRAIVG
jgi:hypothetical protein